MGNRFTLDNPWEDVKRTREDTEQRTAPVLAGLDNVQNVIAAMLRGHQQFIPTQPDIRHRGAGFSVHGMPKALGRREPLPLSPYRPQVEASALGPRVFHRPPIVFKQAPDMVDGDRVSLPAERRVEVRTRNHLEPGNEPWFLSLDLAEFFKLREPSFSGCRELVADGDPLASISDVEREVDWQIGEITLGGRDPCLARPDPRVHCPR
jgi:hypothetical protein